MSNNKICSCIVLAIQSVLGFDPKVVLRGRTEMMKVGSNPFALFAIDELSPKLPANLSRKIQGLRESIFKIGITAIARRRSEIFGSCGK